MLRFSTSIARYSLRFMKSHDRRACMPPGQESAAATQPGIGRDMPSTVLADTTLHFHRHIPVVAVEPRLPHDARGGRGLASGRDSDTILGRYGAMHVRPPDCTWPGPLTPDHLPPLCYPVSRNGNKPLTTCGVHLPSFVIRIRFDSEQFAVTEPDLETSI